MACWRWYSRARGGRYHGSLHDQEFQRPLGVSQGPAHFKQLGTTDSVTLRRLPDIRTIESETRIIVIPKSQLEWKKKDRFG
jgi:hypothetical protein